MRVKPIHIKKILYTTDLSDTSLYAFSYAVELSNKYGATITVLHVLSPDIDIEPLIAGVLGEEQLENIKNRRQNAVREALIGKSRDNLVAEDALAQFVQNVKTDYAEMTFEMDEVLVLRGDPSDKILEVAEKFNFDLIVIGTHGHGLIENIMGTTAQKVLRRSKIPVLSVRL